MGGNTLDQKQRNALTCMRECASIIISQEKRRDCDETRYSKCLAERIIEGIDYIENRDKQRREGEIHGTD